MKKNFLFMLALVFIYTTSYAQIKATTEAGKKVTLNQDGTYEYVKEDAQKEVSSNTFYVIKHVDEMTDKVLHYTNKKLVHTAGKRGFSAGYNVKENKAGNVAVTGLMVKAVGLKCLENVKIYFLFEDGSKFNITSWNDFNCKNNAWFNLSQKHKNQLSAKTLRKIKIQNGYNSEFITYELSEEDKTYFVEMSKSIKNQDIRNEQ